MSRDARESSGDTKNRPLTPENRPLLDWGRDVDEAVWTWSTAGMSNVLGNEKKQQVLALGRLGWSLRSIEQVTGVRRETASGYLKAAAIAVRGRGGRLVDLPPEKCSA